MFDSDALSSEVVSFETEELILVDDTDTEIGFASKAHCHDGNGLLHRAFSILVFNNQGQLLLQQRHKQKRLWGGYWSNSCCSHPRRGESMSEATERRLHEELGLGASLHYLYKFIYSAPFGDVGSERELCHVYAGISDESPNANDNEVQAWRYIDAASLDCELREKPDAFTPWFKQEWLEIKSTYPWLLTAEGIATRTNTVDAKHREQRRAR